MEDNTSDLEKQSSSSRSSISSRVHLFLHPKRSLPPKARACTTIKVTFLILLAALLLTGTTLAIVFGIRASQHQTHVLASKLQTTPSVALSRTWAGAVVTPPSGDRFTNVSAQVTVPTPRLPSDYINDTLYSATAWVGIDGVTGINGNALLQAGVSWNINSTTGATSFVAWNELWPSPSGTFEDLVVSAGDVLDIACWIVDSSSGTCRIVDLTTGRSQAANMTLPESNSGALTGQTAEWIVEDFQNGEGQDVPFAGFSDVKFVDGVAGTAGDVGVLPAEAQTWNIGIGNRTVTGTSVEGQVVIVAYIAAA